MEKNPVDAPESRRKEGYSAAAISLLSVAMTTVGVLLGAGVTAYATVVSAQKSREESCLKRVDDREMLTRKRAEVLLGSMGSFLGSIGPSEGVPREQGRLVMQSAFELTAYAPIELNVIALKISASTYLGLRAHTPEQQENAILAARESFKGWNENYIKFMKSFDNERAKCANQ
ncbi:hypothetical protein [Pseudomonas piscis]|uniref:hypothetical protein n=1 Tax=Pseudomonas piscis TaxID=2614538 RepID=UPI0003B61B37|nr:hypothetical protein [Pseudomonas piscis]ERO65310.1 hypothetical protein P308_19970 [Pseudomonas piscis]